MGIVKARRDRLLAGVRRTGRARLVDLAEELDVSVPTVRRDVAFLDRQGLLVRGHGEVEIATPVARQRPSGAIGIMAMAHRHQGYIAAFVSAARQEIERRNLRCVLEVGEDDSTPEMARRVVEGGCIGIVHIPQWYSRTSELGASLWSLDHDVPVVLAEREVSATHPLFILDSVVTDHRAGLVLALQHLRDLGHHQILTVVEQDSPTTRILCAADQDVRAELGLDTAGSVVSPHPAEEDPRRFRRVIDRIRESGATALFVHNDHLALSLVGELRRAGLDVPRDLSIVAYDDLVGPVGAVPLTTVAPPKQAVAHEAVALIARRHRHGVDGLSPAPTAHMRLVPQLTVRESTAPPAV